MTKTFFRQGGFTMIELMVVVAVIAVLAGIMMPKYVDLITRSQESQIKYNLGAVRGALTVYYSDTEGSYPQDLALLTVGSKYIAALPLVAVPRPGSHPPSAAVTQSDTPSITDSGGWLYDTASGRVTVDCSHNGSDGRPVSVW